MEKDLINKRDDSVFAVLTEYYDAPPEINGIYKTLCSAHKMKTFIEEHADEEDNGYGDVRKVYIRNMFVLD